MWIVLADAHANSCYVRHGAVDLGSGSTKFLIADLDTCGAEPTRIIFQRKAVLKFKEVLGDEGVSPPRELANLTDSQKRLFSDAKREISSFLKVSQRMGAKENHAIATEVFRKEKPAQDFFNSLKDQFTSAKVLDPISEAKLGFQAAKSKVKDLNWVWDIGGGSMQFTNGTNHYLSSDVASVSFKNRLMKRLGKQGTSPNPIGSENLTVSLEEAKLALRESRLHVGDMSNMKVIGIGGVHNGSVRKLLGVVSGETVKVSSEDLKTQLKLWLEKNDAEIGGAYPETEISNVILVVGFLEINRINDFRVVDAPLTLGVLASRLKEAQFSRH